MFLIKNNESYSAWKFIVNHQVRDEDARPNSMEKLSSSRDEGHQSSKASITPFPTFSSFSLIKQDAVTSQKLRSAGAETSPDLLQKRIDGGLVPGASGSEDRHLHPRRGRKHRPDRLHPSNASPQALRDLSPRARRGQSGGDRDRGRLRHLALALVSQDKRVELQRPEVPHHPRGGLQHPLHRPHQHLSLYEAARRPDAGQPSRLLGRVALRALRRGGSSLLFTYASH